MKVAYLSRYNTRSIESWSGTGYFIPNTLEMAGIEVERIDNLPISSWQSVIYSKLVHRILRRPYYPDRTFRSVYKTCDEANRKLANCKCDAIVTTQFPPVSFLRTNKPIVFWNDAAYVQLLGFYHKEPDAHHLKEIKILEKMAFDRAAALVFSSEWAGNSVKDIYGIGQEKIHVIPFGLNSVYHPALVKRYLNGSVIRMLIVGVEWHRKGIDLACELTRRLHQSGVNCELHIVGCDNQKKEIIATEDYFHFHGFLSKKNDNERLKLESIYAATNFFLLPSRADCTPMVVAEANSHSIPVICTDIGGMRTVVNPPHGGEVYPLVDWLKCAFEKIKKCIDNPGFYSACCDNAYNNYNDRLTWERAGEKFKQLLQSVV